MRRWLLVAVLLALLPAAPASAQGSLASDVRGAQVLVVGAPGLRWSDVDPATMPALHALASRSSAGVLSVKALPAVSCPADGWLTLGAGNRAEAFDVPCGEVAADRADLRARNLDSRDAADPDALATALRGAGSCLSARGPGAELAGGEPLTAPTGANQGGSSARTCPVLLLDATVVGADGPARAAGAAAVDALVSVVDAARDPGSTLLVVGLSQVPTDRSPQLQVAVASGPSFPGGALRSASTRRTPYVQLVDVAPTVLDLLDVPQPRAMTGQPWRVVEDAVEPAGLADLSLRAAAADRAVVPFSAALVGALLLGLAVAAVLRSWRLVELVGLGGVGVVTGAFVSVLVPWWRASQPLLALAGVALLVAAVVVVLARRARGVAGPATAACAALAGLLVVDLLTGARLQVDTPFGYSPLVAGRFAGIGNVGFGVYAAAVLLALAGLTHRRRPRAAAAVVAGAGLLAVAVLGAPPFGSDVGGVLALFPAVVLLALLRSGAAVTALRVVLAGVGAVLVVGAFGLLDHQRAPADRTHLGRFVEQVVDGTAGTVLRRKADAVLDLLLANAVTALLPLVVAAAVLLVVRPPAALRRAFDAAPAWRHGLLALGAASAVGFAANDSGPAVPALAILVAAPATLAVVARRAQGDAADR